jgi:DNA-binding transcriptional LysR family regulator
MLGLSNFQRGCLAEEQTFRIGANATFMRQFLLPALSEKSEHQRNASYMTEVARNEEIETRLHDLTLDFGIVTNALLSRPLQTKLLGTWKLELWMPKTLGLNSAKANEAFRQQQLPLALAKKELEDLGASSAEYNACLICDSFLDVLAAMSGGEVASLIPNFLAPRRTPESFMRVKDSTIDSRVFHFYLGWNPRLLRLNPHAARTRDWLADALSERMSVPRVALEL